MAECLVFDRKTERENPDAPPNVYFYACRRDVTQRIFQLLDTQQETLVSFLVAYEKTSPLETCPLPILGTDQNDVRVDAHEALIHHRIYRDPWERRPWTREQGQFFNRRPKKEIDYPHMRQVLEHLNSQPVTVKRIEFSESGKPHDSFFEEVDIPSPWKGKEGEACHGEVREGIRRITRLWVRTVRKACVRN